MNLRVETPDYDSIPKFDTMLGRVLHYASVFGMNTNDLERKDDDLLFMRRTISRGVIRIAFNHVPRALESIWPSGPL